MQPDAAAATRPISSIRSAEAETPGRAGGETPPAPDNLVEEEILVEEISIDGMCGVY